VGALVPGDTIRATIQHSATDALKEVADSLKTQVSEVLRDTRKLLASLERTSTAAEQELRLTGPEIRLAIRECGPRGSARAPVKNADSLVLAIEPRVDSCRTPCWRRCPTRGDCSSIPIP